MHKHTTVKWPIFNYWAINLDVRLFTALYFSVRSLRWSTLHCFAWGRVSNLLSIWGRVQNPGTCAPSVHLKPRWPPIMESTQSSQSYKKIWKYCLYNYYSIQYILNVPVTRPCDTKSPPKVGHYLRIMFSNNCLLLAFSVPKELLYSRNIAMYSVV